MTAQALNDPSILDKGFDLLLGKEKFPSMVGFFTTWASSPQMAEPLFKSVSGAAARYPDRYFALSAIASPEMQRRYEAAGIGLLRGPVARGPVDRRRDALRRAHRPPRRTRSRRCRSMPRRCRRARSASTRRRRILAAAGIPILGELLATSTAEAAAAQEPRRHGWCSRSSRPRSPTRPKSAASCSTCRRARPARPMTELVDPRRASGRRTPTSKAC